MKLATLIASRNRPDLVESMVTSLQNQVTIPNDLIVVECGTDPELISPQATLQFPDPDFRGKCFGHNLALKYVQLLGDHDYYWVLMNDLVFTPGLDPARVLIETMEQYPRMAILSPTCEDGIYPSSKPRANSDWRKVTTCDYLGFMMRGQALSEVGFLSPDFKYCWGAIHELAYKLYSRDWFIAYTDDVTYRHLGGSTYGQKGTKTISREEYQRRAKLFAYDYMLEHYGPDWEKHFWEVTNGHEIAVDTFAEHKRLWSEVFSREELIWRDQRGQPPVSTGSPAYWDLLITETTTPNAAESEQEPQPVPAAISGADQELRLHLGSGGDYRQGWVNVDLNPEAKPDIISQVESLPMFANDSVDEIEACHLLEHLTLTEAQQALREWHRVLKPGGKLNLELPNFAACIEILGRYQDNKGFDLGMIGIYGWPPSIDEEGPAQIHKWGWTPQSLTQELSALGFDRIETVPITQLWRMAARAGRDMRLQAVKAVSDNDAFTLATDARIRLLAWPRYDSMAELNTLMDEFAHQLVSRPDTCLCLRHDSNQDISQQEAFENLQQAYSHKLPAGAALNILLVDDNLTDVDLECLGREVSWALRLPSSHGGPRAEFIAGLRVPILNSGEELSAALCDYDRRYQLVQDLAEVGDDELHRRAERLSPWFYPVRLGGREVQAGQDSEWPDEHLRNRVACRRKLLVDEIVERYDFRGKTVLELACNSAYWSSQYVAHGAARVVGIEGRSRFVQQAELTWAAKQLLPPDRYCFFQADVTEVDTWARIRELGPFDFTLCAGLLYHIQDYRWLLARMREVTREAMVIDTRVTHEEERIVLEPGDLHFNALPDKLPKTVPNRECLLQVLREQGFAPEILPVTFDSPPGLQDVDDYNLEHRLALFAPVVPAATCDFASGGLSDQSQAGSSTIYRRACT